MKKVVSLLYNRSFELPIGKFVRSIFLIFFFTIFCNAIFDNANLYCMNQKSDIFEEINNAKLINDSVDVQYKIITHIIDQSMHYFLDGQTTKAIDYMSYIEKLFQEQYRIQCYRKCPKEILTNFFFISSLLSVDNKNKSNNLFRIDDEHDNTFFHNMHENIENINLTVPLQSSMNLETVYKYIGSFLKMQFDYHQYKKISSSNIVHNKTSQVSFQEIFSFLEDVLKNLNVGSYESSVLNFLKTEINYLTLNSIPNTIKIDNKWLYSDDNPTAHKLNFFINSIGKFLGTSHLTIVNFSQKNSPLIKEIAQKKKSIHDQIVVAILQQQFDIINFITTKITSISPPSPTWLKEIATIIPSSFLAHCLSINEYDHKEEHTIPFTHTFVPEKLFTSDDNEEWKTTLNRIKEVQDNELIPQSDEKYYQNLSRILKNIVSLQGVIKPLVTASQIKAVEENHILYKLDLEKLRTEIEKPLPVSKIFSYLVQEILCMLPFLETIEIKFINGTIMVKNTNINLGDYNLSPEQNKDIVVGYFALIDFFLEKSCVNKRLNNFFITNQSPSPQDNNDIKETFNQSSTITFENNNNNNNNSQFEEKLFNESFDQSIDLQNKIFHEIILNSLYTITQKQGLQKFIRYISIIHYLFKSKCKNNENDKSLCQQFFAPSLVGKKSEEISEIFKKEFSHLNINHIKNYNIFFGNFLTSIKEWFTIPLSEFPSMKSQECYDFFTTILSGYMDYLLDQNRKNNMDSCRDPKKITISLRKINDFFNSHNHQKNEFSLLQLLQSAYKNIPDKNNNVETCTFFEGNLNTKKLITINYFLETISLFRREDQLSIYSFAISSDTPEKKFNSHRLLFIISTATGIFFTFWCIKKYFPSSKNNYAL